MSEGSDTYKDIVNLFSSLYKFATHNKLSLNRVSYIIEIVLISALQKQQAYREKL